MKSLQYLLCLLPCIVFAQSRTISGTVTDGTLPLENVNVFVTSDYRGGVTDTDGKYRIEVTGGEVLMFTFQGKQNHTYKVDDLPNTFDVVMLPKVEELDNVIVEQQRVRLKSQRELFESYNLEKGIIKSAYQLMDKEISGIALEIREGNQINPASTNIVSALQSLFAGVSVSPKGAPMVRMNPDDPNAVIYNRGPSSINHPIEAIYDVDGIIYTDPPRFLDLGSIKRIARLPGLAGTSIYGSIGGGGVFIINTKTANVSPTAAHLAHRKKQALIKSYDGHPLTEKQLRNSLPKYLVELDNANGLDESITVFEKYRKIYGTTPIFVLDGLHFFMNKYPESDYFKTLLEETGISHTDKIEVLRAMGMIMEVNGKSDLAKDIYLRGLVKWPRSPQSYLQLARVHVTLGNIPRAAHLIGRYNHLLNKKMLAPELEGSHPIFITEFNNVAQNNAIGHASSDSSNDTKKGAIRIVLEWNDDQAAIEFHFVDPLNNYFIWDNGVDDESGQEINYPISAVSKEYFIPEEGHYGPWYLHAKYLGNGRLTPTYVKVGIYHDYGLKTERKEEKLIRLSLKKGLVNLYEIYKPNPMAYNSPAKH